MYSAFWLWAIAQALLLPNWVGGFAGLVGFGMLFFGRVAREEQMMSGNFWRQLSHVHGADRPGFPESISAALNRAISATSAGKRSRNRWLGSLFVAPVISSG